jgi:hypothetical protein
MLEISINLRPMYTGRQRNSSNNNGNSVALMIHFWHVNIRFNISATRCSTVYIQRVSLRRRWHFIHFNSKLYILGQDFKLTRLSLDLFPILNNYENASKGNEYKHAHVTLSAAHIGIYNGYIKPNPCRYESLKTLSLLMILFVSMKRLI